MRPGDLVLTLGAGDVGAIADQVRERLATRETPTGDPASGGEGDHMLGEIRGEVRFKEPLAFHTSLRCGGPADIFIVPQDVDDIRKALMFADREQLPVAVLGGGNNMLVRDRGFRGVVLKIEGCLGRMEFHGEEVTIGCGAGLSTMIREAAALGLGGIECLVGIPATLGGALAMNAGTHDGAIWDFVSAVYFLHADGTIGELKPAPGCPCTAPSRSRPGRSSWGCGCSSTGSRRRRSWPRSGRDSSRRSPRSRSRSRRRAPSGRTPTTTRP